ncbi:hypothetical protein HYV82_01435 [Candidatus Woesearchaeota archaeon]|nr:hypothetical protein [Candidatus Woesearchaeota archaeon]
MALFGILLKSIMLLVLMAVAVLPTLYKRWIKVDMGIEFIVFAIVLVGINYGRVTGAIFGAAAMLASDVITKDIGPWTLLNMAAMAAGGIIAGIMGNANLLLTGLVTVVAVDAIRKTPPILLGGGKEKFESLINTPIHLLLNLWLFMMLSKVFGL